MFEFAYYFVYFHTEFLSDITCEEINIFIFKKIKTELYFLLFYFRFFVNLFLSLFDQMI